MVLTLKALIFIIRVRQYGNMNMVNHSLTTLENMLKNVTACKVSKLLLMVLMVLLGLPLAVLNIYAIIILNQF
ncbi:unnamed protein product, partial [Iphiclides podalirius]